MKTSASSVENVVCAPKNHKQFTDDDTGRVVCSVGGVDVGVWVAESMKGPCSMRQLPASSGAMHRRTTLSASAVMPLTFLNVARTLNSLGTAVNDTLYVSRQSRFSCSNTEPSSRLSEVPFCARRVLV